MEAAQEQHAQAVWTDLTALEWPLQVDPAIRKRYETLTQISLGQEEVDEHILRDIGRTFPEYAQFQDLEGQRALFDVLKAYSMADLEVEYCQGMAFVAGTALMFLPEELAFELFHFVMAESGCMITIALAALQQVVGGGEACHSGLQIRLRCWRKMRLLRMLPPV